MIKFFNVIKSYFNKDILPNFILFNNLKKNNIPEIKNIIIWLMCNKKKKFICKNCESCLNFQKKTNYDFYYSINISDNISNDILENMCFFLRTKPIFSKIKVMLIFLNLKNEYIVNLIEKNVKNKSIYIFLISNENKIDIKNNNLILNTKNIEHNVSINVIKIMYYNLIQNNYNQIFNKIKDLNKITVINSLIFFFKIYLKKNYLKKYKILLNKKITYKMHTKNILYLIILLNKYKKTLTLNKNLNIFILINFILEYINH